MSGTDLLTERWYAHFSKMSNYWLKVFPLLSFGWKENRFYNMITTRLIGSIGPGWVWCHGPADAPPTPPLYLHLMDHGGLDRGPCRLPTIHTLFQTHWMCCNSIMILSGLMTSIVHLVTWHLLFIWSHDIYCPSGHMTSILLSILERDPPLLLSWRVLHFFGSCSWCDVRSKVRDVYVYRL